MGGVVVEHEVDVEFSRDGPLDSGEEFTEFDCATPLIAAANDPAGGNVEGGEQRGRAVALVVMAAPLDSGSGH